jgi:hypothetical protein
MAHKKCKCGHEGSEHINTHSFCLECDCQEYEPVNSKRPTVSEVAAASKILSARHSDCAAPWESLNVLCKGIKRAEKELGNYMITVKKV